MKTFNAFQAVCLFAAAPFLMGWLTKNPFPYAQVALWITGIAYLVGFIASFFLPEPPKELE